MTTDYSKYKYYKGQKVNPYANPYDLDQPLDGLVDPYWQWERDRSLAEDNLSEEERNILLGKDKAFNDKMDSEVG